MNSKRYIPLIVIGALILSLLAVIPAFGAGEVSFIDPDEINDRNDGSLSDPTPDEQESGRQGGLVGLMLEDDSLDVPVRHVLIPELDSVKIGTSSVDAHKSTLTFNVVTANNVDNTAQTVAQTVGVGDYLMVGEYTVRKITNIETPTVTEPTKPTLAAQTGDEGAPTIKDLDSVTEFTQGEIVSKSKIAEVTVPTGKEAKIATIAGTGLDGTGLTVVTKPEAIVGGTSTEGSVVVTGTVSAAAPLGYRQVTITATLQAQPTNLVSTKKVLIKIVSAGSSENRRVFTLDRPFPKAESAEEIRKITISKSVRDDVKWADEYHLYAKADEITTANSEISALPKKTQINPAAGTLADSGVSVDLADDATNVGANIRLAGNPDGTVNNNDVIVVNVDVAKRVATPVASSVFAEQIQIDTNAVKSGIPQYLIYWSEEKNYATVSVRSQAFQTATKLVLPETTGGSGEFALQIQAVKDDTNKPVINTAAADTNKNPLPTLPVNPRDVITLSTSGSSTSLTIETTPPIFSGLSPAHNSAGRDDRPEVSAQVTDGDSGLDESDIKVLFMIDESGNVDYLGKTPDGDGDVDSISGGFEIVQRLSGAESPDGDAKIYWWIMATDKAGNIGFSDRLTTKEGVANLCMATEASIIINDDKTATGVNDLESLGCDPYLIKVDGTDPTLLRAEAGRHWNSGLTTEDSDDKTEYRASKSKKNSVLVVFDEHLDAGTVTASDFEVNDSQPQDAEVRNVKVRNDAEDGDGNPAILGNPTDPVGDERGYVFLTLSSDLPANAQPKVELVSEITDLAGNTRNTGRDADAEDRIAPSLTVTIDEGDRPVTKGKINLTITSDENVGTPIVTFYEIMSSDDVQARGTENTGTVRFVSATEYKAEIDAGSDENGLFTVYVTAVDNSGGNTGTAGDKSAPVDVDGTTTAILFEHDENMGDPDVDPDMDGIQRKFTIDDPNAFVRIDFSAEANEYDDGMYDLNNPKTDAPGDDTRGDDLDTHASVTINSATLGGVDIKDDLQSNDAGNVFLYKATGLAIGEHKLEVVAMDEAGNVHPVAAEATITITERKPYSLKLNPGWNLVSIPGEPAVSDINTVITYADNPDIKSVTTYDPSVPGFWLTATRGADNMFTGTLTNITSTRGYLVETDSFKPLKVDIPKQSLGAMLLPGITIVKGWNLVPILDVNGDFKLEFNTKADDGDPAKDGEASSTVNYFSGLTANDNAVGIYTFNTVTGSWTSVRPQDVEIGKAYWIYAEKEGVIIP